MGEQQTNTLSVIYFNSCGRAAIGWSVVQESLQEWSHDARGTQGGVLEAAWLSSGTD